MGPRLFSRGERYVCTSMVTQRSFNGAAAFQPRREPLRHRGFGWKSPVSMGPRLFSRGECRRTAPPHGTSSFQWGRGFSAAESRLAVIHNGVLNMFQWGRGFSAAERGLSAAAEPRWDGFNGAAAFQPRRGSFTHTQARQTSRFNGAAAFQPRRGGDVERRHSGARVSMGPRLFSRGETNKGILK